MSDDKPTGPISFSALLIPRILDDSKTQSRRVMTPQPPEWITSLCGPEWYTPSVVDRHGELQPAKDDVFGAYSEDGEYGLKSPYGAPGDRLWVQEGYQITEGSGGLVSGRYLADGQPFVDVRLTDDEWGKWTRRKHPRRASPGRFMYRSLSRITLDLTDVRAQRVQEISEEDALAEGITTANHRPVGYGTLAVTSARERFSYLWDSINDARGHGFEVDPYVWALTFRRVRTEEATP